MKKIINLILIMVLVLTSNVTAFSKMPSLPDLTLDELEPLEKPELSKDYGDMLEELELEGFGDYKFGKGEELPLLDVEAPKGTGKTADEKFNKEFGNMWKNNQLDKLKIIPKDEFFEKYSTDYKKRNGNLFHAVMDDNNDQMKTLLAQRLDTSKYMYDFDSFNANKLMSTESLKNLLNGASKPAGWSSQLSQNLPNRLLKRPDGYGESKDKGMFSTMGDQLIEEAKSFGGGIGSTIAGWYYDIKGIDRNESSWGDGTSWTEHLPPLNEWVGNAGEYWSGKLNKVFKK